MRRVTPTGMNYSVIFENHEACHTDIRVWQVFCVGVRRGSPVEPVGGSPAKNPVDIYGMCPLTC